jgi:hypothetical protein
MILLFTYLFLFILLLSSSLFFIFRDLLLLICSLLTYTLLSFLLIELFKSLGRLLVRRELKDPPPLL